MKACRARRALFAAVIAIVALVAPAVAANAEPGAGQPGAASLTAARPGAAYWTAARPGAAGAGDPYFPLSGNGGFHVSHYGIDLDYTPSTAYLRGMATISAVATQALSRFDLDFSGLRVSTVTVDGRRAAYSRSGQELVITPLRSLRRWQRFTVQVRYSGVPVNAIDPDDSVDGWIRTAGGVFVASEPQGAMTWFPANAHPVDKSAFDVTVRVPKGYTAVGNGELVSQRSSPTSSTFQWRQRQPMAAYLATASIAKFKVTRYNIGRLPVYVAVEPSQASDAATPLAKLPQMLKWEIGLFGPYPFSSAGAIVMDAPDVGYALETQTRPLFDRAPDDSTLVHELAHQWFGDSVSITRWQDIWLNEGFATYAEWLWSEKNGEGSAQDIFDGLYAQPATDCLWARPVADPGSGANIFDCPVYDRGAMVLHKLRQRVGDPTFLKILRTWATTHRYGHGTTVEFTALAGQLSHQNLASLFQTWLYTGGKPARP